jgi:hypothetical protein
MWLPLRRAGGTGINHAKTRRSYRFARGENVTAMRSNELTPPRKLHWHTWVSTLATLAALISTLVAPAVVVNAATSTLYLDQAPIHTAASG